MTDIALEVGRVKWQWAGHIVVCRRTDNHWSKCVLEWRPRLGKHSVDALWLDGAPPSDLHRMAGSD